MTYKIKDTPEYLDTSRSKNVAIRWIISVIVAVIVFMIAMNGFLPDKDFLNDLYRIYGDKQAAEQRYNEYWSECWNTGFGVCFFSSVALGLLTLGVCCIFLPNEKKRKNADIFKEYYNFPDDLYRVRLLDGIYDIPEVEMAAWLKNDELHISAVEYKYDFGEIIIPTKNIVFFVRDGDFYTKTVLNRDGRLIGGLIAGPTGVLMGTNTSAETVEVDKRRTILYLQCGGEEKALFFSSGTYNSFMSMLPQLEYKRVVSKQRLKETRAEKAPSVKDTSDNFEQIKKLKELLDMGAISQEEYDLKKQELLSKI